MTIIYDKLVRDGIQEIIENDDKTPIGHIATEEEYKQRLAEKLVEEANEFCQAPSKEELADTLEVIDAIYEAYGFSRKEVADVQTKKREKRGGFKQKYVLDRVEKS